MRFHFIAKELEIYCVSAGKKEKAKKTKDKKDEPKEATGKEKGKKEKKEVTEQAEEEPEPLKRKRPSLNLTLAPKHKAKKA